MKTFTDNAGRVWTLTLDVTAVKRVKGRLDVNLYELVDDGFKGLAKLLDDPSALVDILYVLCEEQAGKLGLDDLAFGQGMRGEAIWNAGKAFHAEYADFFHDPRVKAGLLKAIEAADRLETVTMRRVKDDLAAIDLDDLVNRLTRPSGNSPASSASTPGPSPTGSYTPPPSPDSGLNGTGPPRSSPSSPTSTATTRSDPILTPSPTSTLS